MKIPPEQAQDMMVTNPNAIILDVREQWKHETLGKIPGSVHVYVKELSERIQTIIPDKNAMVLIYCTAGVKSAAAYDTMRAMGYTDVYDFGGIDEWPGAIVP